MGGNHGNGPADAPRWTDAERAKVADMLVAGLSASKVAANLGTGLTRNAIIGRVSRDKMLKAIGFKGNTGAIPQKKSKYAGVLAKPKPFEALNIAVRMESRALAPKPSMVVEKINTPLVCRSIPLMELKHGDCRWVCNEAGPGELHLFCANPADGSYCHEHRLRSRGQGTVSEQRASEVRAA